MNEASFLYLAGLLITLIAAWMVFQVIVRREYRLSGSLSFSSTALEFLIFGIHANLPYLYLSVPWPQLPSLPDNLPQAAIGLAVLGAGLLATLAIMARLGFRTTVGAQPDQLRQSGPYRFTRNPQLLTYGLTLLGFLILYPSWQGAAWLVLYGTMAHMMALTEEEHLSRLFGAAYEQYCRQVPRYIVQLKRSSR